MQAKLGSQVTGETVPVHYAYVARYCYADVAVQNDNFLMVSAYTDQYQTAGDCDVQTTPQGRKVKFTDRMGNLVHRVRVTVPHLDSPAEAQAFTSDVLAGLDQVCKIIDDSWFHREPLSEEEVYRRFVQQ